MDKAAVVREKKKKWRENQYKSQMGSRAAGHGFAEKRKLKFVHDYKKLLRKESQKDQPQNTRPKPGMNKNAGDKELGHYYKSESQKDQPWNTRPKPEMNKNAGDKELGHYYKSETQKDQPWNTRPKPEMNKNAGDKKLGRYHKAELEFKKKKEEKAKEMKAKQAKKAQMNEAMEKYKTKKKGQQKLLSKKNFRGQPNMASRMTLLLSKIEEMQKS